MINYIQILTRNFADRGWSVEGNTYAGIKWSDESPKPTQAELDALWDSTQDSIARDQTKTEAKKRIATTDWSVLPDVGISNTAEFEAYRAALRELIKNPVAEPVWPTEPQPVWS